MTLDRAIADALASLVEVYDDVVSDSVVFPEVSVTVAPSDHRYRVGTIELAIGAFQPDGTELSARLRYFEVSALTPTGASRSRVWLESGTKAELLATLQDPDTIDRVHRAVAKMADSLEENDFL